VRVRLLIALAAALAVAHAASFLGAGPFDDDFICYRYAYNLVEGHGLVFNPGERVEGFSNPLWVLLLAGGVGLGLEPVQISLWLSVLATGVAAWAVGEAWRGRHPQSAWPAPALLLAACPALAWHGVVGLGTTVMAALLALFAWRWDRARLRGKVPWGAGVWLALACLLRQEALLLVLPFAAVEWRGRGRAALVPPLVALAGWTLFRWGYYGRLLPMPWYAKKLPLLADWGYGARYLLLATAECGIALLALLGLAAHRGTHGALRSSTRALAWGVLLHTAYVVHVGGDFVALARFCVPVLPLALLSGCAGARALLPATPAALAGIVLLLGMQWTQFDWRAPQDNDPPGAVLEARPYRFLDHQAFEERWIDLGQHFREVALPGTRVALSPIGAFGYHSRLPVVDLLGLTSESTLGVQPDLERVKVKGHHRLNVDWVLASEPDVFILGNGVGGRELSINPWEGVLWERLRRHPGYQPMVMAIPEGEVLLVWVRVGAAIPRGAVRVR